MRVYTDQKIQVDVVLSLEGKEVGLNEKYFKLMGESAVFTPNKRYRVLDFDKNIATMEDDKGVKDI